MSWYLVIRRAAPTPPETGASAAAPPPDVRAVDDHLAWLRVQHGSGAILISGPRADHTTSLYVLRAPSREAAAALVAEDPLTPGPGASTEIIEWEVHQMLGLGGFDRETLELMVKSGR